MNRRRTETMLLSSLLLVGGMVLADLSPARAAGAYLINAGWHGNTIPTPSFIQANLTFLETQPFDGLVIYLRNPAGTVNVTHLVMTNTPVSYQTAQSVLSPIQGLGFVNLTQNFALVMGTYPPDFFDDWSVPIQNFANLARAAKEVGLKGIVFDNEQYFSPWANYPVGVAYPSKTLQEYLDQARLRGKQVMQAMQAEFPEIVVLHLHGPGLSEFSAPDPPYTQNWHQYNELQGPFYAGGVEGVGPSATMVDGGELYTLRTAAEFEFAYDWNKNVLPSASVDCPFIPLALRPLWPGRSSIALGVYDTPWGGAPMDPTVLKPTLVNALQRADRYVWFYPEQYTYLRPPGPHPDGSTGAPANWVEAIRQARDEVGGPPQAQAAPTELIVTAAEAISVRLSWRDNSTNESGFSIERKGLGGSFAAVASVGGNVTSFTDLGLIPTRSYAYRVLAFNAQGSSAASNEIAVTTPAKVVSLLNAGWFGNTIPTPSYIQSNFAFLETQPFDGLVVYARNQAQTVNVTLSVMTTAPMSYQTMLSVLSPLQGLPFVRNTQNLVLVTATYPPDFFDDWSVTIQNFANLARAARDVGLKGIFFINVNDPVNFESWGNHPDDVAYASKTLQEYRDQARLRGKQVMQAMLAEFPDLVFLTLRGPSISEVDAPPSLGFPQVQEANELQGPFYAGGIEAGILPVTIVDGGELFTLRSAEDFQAAYDWNKYLLPSASVDCPFIPLALRSLWPDRSSIAFGVYDTPWGGAPMDPTVLKPTLAHAMQQADRYIWFYPEQYTYLRPPGPNQGAPAVWVDAIRQARVPPEVTGLIFEIDKTILTWDPLANVTGYDLLRATSPTGFAAGVCLVTAGATSSAVDSTAPAAAGAFFYVARGRNAGGVGTIGTDSSGTERTARTCP